MARYSSNEGPFTNASCKHFIKGRLRVGFDLFILHQIPNVVRNDQRDPFRGEVWTDTLKDREGVSWT